MKFVLEFLLVWVNMIQSKQTTKQEIKQKPNKIARDFLFD